ncbi:Uncharacterized protein ChrSV_4035 [Chromobacterium vaccinii]|nr:Uncharacterized protein ChrSW_4035 [Chromobacterium vaccinii]QND91492.1 Uncharacterized protein ChrSV_4035 [Chromobacterium vaccinii]SUX56065.1 Uncharacterised protein [Chromobacterium vaccinii]
MRHGDAQRFERLDEKQSTRRIVAYSYYDMIKHAFS